MGLIKKGKADLIFDTVNKFFMVLVLIVMIYPLWFTVVASFSDPFAVARGHVVLWPVGFTLEAYRNVFSMNIIWQGYMNTIFYTVAGTAFNLLLTIPTAYVLSKKQLPGRNILVLYFLTTMYFGGGLIPTYLNIKSLGLIDKPYTLIILGGLSVYNVIVTRVYFQNSVPDELYESAHMDGASEFRVFFQVALPLAKPIIAVMTLFYAVSHWNNFFSALLYITDNKLYPLQLVLRSILIMNESLAGVIEAGEIDPEALEELARRAYLAEAMKYSLIFISSAPLLVAYPFVQKYFVKGIMIGSLKG